MKMSLAKKTERLKTAAQQLKALRVANARLRSYIEALEPMAVRSVSLTPAQLRSAVRRRMALNQEGRS